MSEIQSCFKRYEKKYLLTQAQYEAMRLGMAPYMQPDAHPQYSISNIYYDTDSYDLIRASLEKPIYKEKLRLRSYGVPGQRDTVFVEIKKKYDDVVYKRRITMEMQAAALYLNGVPEEAAGQTISGLASFPSERQMANSGQANHGLPSNHQTSNASQITREIDYFLNLYQPRPRVFIAYDREAYAAADGGELRITFDTALRARTNDLDLRLGDHGLPLLSDAYRLMEVKIPGTAPLWLARLLSANAIFPTSFSKYGAFYTKFLLGGKSANLPKEDLRKTRSAA